MVDFVKACQWFGILSVQSLVLVHVHYAKLVLLLRILALCVGSTLDFEEEPIAVAFRVCVRPYVQVEFTRLDLDCKVQVARFKLGVEDQVALIPVLRLYVRLLQAIVDRCSWCLYSLKAANTLHTSRDHYVIVFTLFIVVVDFLAKTEVKLKRNLWTITLVSQPTLKVRNKIFLGFLADSPVIYAALKVRKCEKLKYLLFLFRYISLMRPLSVRIEVVNILEFLG